MLTACCPNAGRTQAVLALAVVGNALLRQGIVKTPARLEAIRLCNDSKLSAVVTQHEQVGACYIFTSSPLHFVAAAAI